MHIIKTQSFDKGFIKSLFLLTRKMRAVDKAGGNTALAGKIVASLFYEASTRTRLSFEAAAMRLGANIITTENARTFSSAAKGESLEDSIRVIDKYCDCIVLRYHEEGGAARAAHISSVPVINAGDGGGQHPTQALLDLFTIRDELGDVDGLKIALVGDLKNGRTAHSLVYLLAKYRTAKLYLISPQNLRMPTKILDYLRSSQVRVEQSTSLTLAASQCDVVYQTRIQRERFISPEEYEKSQGKLIINRDILELMKQDSIIMHPLPRLGEIRYSVDKDPRAAYFRQAQNGLHVRMALLQMLLGE